jgi:histidinol phosphatase-like PHP family hydrolase
MSSSLFQDRYLFHLHTVATDGQLTVEEYFQHASTARYDRLIFLEHIRKDPRYDVEAFAASVREASGRYSVPASVGFEAKVLPDHSLDISPEHFRMAEVVGIAEHGFPGDPDQLADALDGCFSRYSQERGPVVLVWAHPGLWFQRKGFLEKQRSRYASLMENARGQGILIERNLRYNLCTRDLYDSLPAGEKVLGLDCHTLKDLHSNPDPSLPETGGA